MTFRTPTHAALAAISRNFVALARALLAEGARVTIAAPGPVDPSLAQSVDELRAAGASFVDDLGAVRDADLYFIEGYGGGARDVLAAARQHHATLSTLVDYVFARAGARSLGVTGTAGKSTVTALVAHLLRSAGITTHTVTDRGPEDQLGPNYELVDALDTLRSGFLVVELAEQRTATMQSSPDIAVVASFAHDHIEDFGSYEAYLDGTRTIVRHQDADGWAVLPRARGAHELFVPFCRGRVMTFAAADSGGDAAVFVRDGRITGRLDGAEHDLGRAPDDPVGLENEMAACAAALVAGAEPAAIAHALSNFPGTRFRRELVCDVRGIRVVNDSLAATPLKALAGLETVDRPVVWIAGGQATFRSEVFVDGAPALDDLRALAAAASTRVKAAFVIGASGAVLLEQLVDHGVAAVAPGNLDAAVAAAVEAAREGDLVLFSPGMYVPPAERERFDVIVRDALFERSGLDAPPGS